MLRGLFTFLIIFITVISTYGQLASWSLTTDGQPAGLAANVNALALTTDGGTNTLSFGTSGASCSGWTVNTTPDATDYFQTGIAPALGYRLNIQTIAFSERRSLTGPGEYQLQYSTSASFSNPVTLATVPLPDNDLTRDGTISGLNIIVNDGDTLYLRWFGYKAEGGTGTWRISAGTLSLSGVVTQANPNNNDSYALAPTTQVAASNITPIISGETFEVFRFNIADAGSGDALPTNVSFISIENANPAAGATWSQTIQNCILKQGANTISTSSVTITDNNIFLGFPSSALVVPDGGNLEYSLYIQLNDQITDNSNLQFKINAASSGWDASVAGSGFALTFPLDVVSQIHTIEVNATVFSLADFPPAVWKDIPFSITVVAIDYAGNIDTDYNQSGTFSVEFGSGTLAAAGGLTQNFSSGALTISDLTYSGTEWMKIRLSDPATLIPSISTPLLYSAPDNLVLDDNFNDGDYPVNPVWIGTTVDFVISAENRLQLNTVSTDDDTAYVSSPVSIQADSLEWNSVIKLNLDPSSNNYVKYFLISDQPDLKSPVNGYYIQLGETGTTDALEMFRLDNGIPTSIMRGPNGQVATSPYIRVKIIGRSDGNWKMYADLTGGTGYQLIAQTTDATYIMPRFFTGYYCRFSQTYAAEKFEFDDAYCGPVRVDSVAPTVTLVSLLDSTTLQVTFSEAITETDAQNIANYNVSNGVDSPVTAVQNQNDKTKVLLTFSPPFQSETNYVLTVSGLHDLSGNALVISQHPFSFYRVKMFDVVINEIMSDPSPVVQLPEWEYLELYNRSNFPIDLTNWTITVGSSTKVFPTSSIPAGGYIVLTHENADTLFGAINILGLFTSSTLLTNSDAEVFLKDNTGRLIHAVQYSDTWHDSSFKLNGGWSLEQIDPSNPCGEGSNWKSCESNMGGTPGLVNSVNASNADENSPVLLKAILYPTDTVYLFFNEILDTAQALNPLTYSVDNSVGSPVSATFTDSWNKVIKLVFNHSFGADTIFTITAGTTIRDCAGNLLTTNNTARFALTDLPAADDIAINEVLFDPLAGGTDFIEFYNRSQKVFNLKDLMLATYDGSEVSGTYTLSAEGQYIFPGEYLVVSENSEIIATQYNVPDAKTLVNIASMPSLNTDAGRVTLMTRVFETIDDFSYTVDMHFALLASFKGVSLERVHYDLPASDKNNWHSAAESVGFATPGYKNSQFTEPGTSDDIVSLEPEIFSPDMDGYNDMLHINYKLDKAGYVANITIFDSRGKKIRTLVSNEILAAQGYFVWDGLDNENHKANLGIYIVYIELFDLDGNLKHYKKSCVLATKFD